MNPERQPRRQGRPPGSPGDGLPGVPQSSSVDSFPDIGRGVWGSGDSDGSDIPVTYQQPHWSFTDTVNFACFRLRLKWAQRVAWGIAVSSLRPSDQAAATAIAAAFALAALTAPPSLLIRPCPQLLCVIESALAALQRHYVGIIAGLIAAAASWYLTAAMRAGHHTRTRCFHAMTFVAVILGGYVLALIVIRAMSGLVDESLPFRSFPDRCPPGRGCARLAFSFPQGMGDETVPIFSADAGQVMDAALESLRPQAQVYRVSPASEEPGYLQLVWLSVVWGFPDDMAIRLRCNGTQTSMQVHSQQRSEISCSVRLLQHASAPGLVVPCRLSPTHPRASHFGPCSRDGRLRGQRRTHSGDESSRFSCSGRRGAAQLCD